MENGLKNLRLLMFISFTIPSDMICVFLVFLSIESYILILSLHGVALCAYKE